MDKEEESSCSHQVYTDQSDSNTIGKNWLGTPFDETTYEETSVRKSDLGSTSQMVDFNIGIHNKLSMDDGNTWHTDVSFGDLLAMATIGKVGNNSDVVDTQQYGQVDYDICLSDLNLPPQTVNESYVSTGLSLAFTPVTPNQGRRAEQHKQVESEIVDSNENERMDLNLAADKEMANLDEHSQADVSTFASVNEDMEKGLTEQTNLNETPQPKQRRRRRKHRPKVVIEGQRKRARKSATPKPETPKPGATSTGKRKYVRRKGIEKSTETPTVGEACGTVDPSTSTNQQTKKTCKRKINFDEPEQQTEVMVEKTQVEHTVDKTTCSTSEVVENFQKVLNSESPSPKPENPKPGATSTRKRKYVRRTRIEKSTETPTVGEVSATVDPSTSTNQQTKKTCNRKINFDEPGQQTEVMVEKTQVEHTVDKTTCSTSEVVENFQKVLNSESPSPITPSKAELPRGGSTKSTKSTCKINFLQETHDKGESSVPSPNESNCSTSACFNKGKEAQGSKEGFSRNMDGVTLFDGNALGISDEETYLSMFTNYNSGSNGIQLPVIIKKRRIRKKQSGMIATTSASKAPEMPKDNGVYMQNSRKKKTTDFRMVHDQVAFAGMIDGRYQQPTYMEAHATEFQLSLVTKKKSLVPPFYHYQQYFTNHIGSNPNLRCKSTFDIEALIYKFERLNINRQVAEKYRNAVIPYMSGYHEKNALVVFQRDGTLVPYVKKRKARPKVDLDDETARVWKLLLEDINSEGIDGTDEAKAKWWEEERKVFRGRAESFIARMHLVQGDRRFSKWKGSVLDSVVGVFLTQNVSDHLSSSAFMSLAARYPLKSKRSSEAPHEEESIMSVKEPCQEDEDRGSMMLQSADPCEEKEIVNSNELSQNSVVTFDLNDNLECEVLEISEKDSAVYKETVMDQTEVDDIHSSQDSAHTSPSSVQSSIVHNSERLGSSSVHNSREQKDRSISTALDGYTSFVEMLHKQGPTTVDETYSQQLAEDSTEQTLSAKEHELPNTCTLEASAFESFAVREERKLIQAQNKKSASEESRLSSESASQTTVQMVKSISSQESVKSSNTCINCEMQEVVDLTNVSVETPKSTQSNNIIEASGETAHKVVKFNLKDSGGSQIVKGIDKDSSKVKKEKTGKEQIKVEWDNLRLEAEVKQKRERAPDTMDSLDYEAVRAANVDDVADSIKERGMNNRLAARIKDMLDRLVADHGSIDLEWLRDVPPDKAKEYLLSFKGLGLKSVECIRLLTLHHLAFPVDTNVGRIAVRLGWVPLQPLPESLQLHLLELYPIMESIQQYLWPRLCKLDQRTLYELHYQMITFGKVFCTKTKPNCNACPLRGECRHFASAFASARLGLPAPEESVNRTGQSPVGMIDQPSTSINRSAQSPAGMIDLPPASNQLQQLPEAQNCNSVNKETETPGPLVELPATPGPIVEVPASPEPIIEVPATPEPEQIQQELDIEDFCEDPEEIPMIKLNIEQFTQNLQTFMERHMELGEGDMSKALVALTSEAASIPTPKLKNVSQLRTEHQVYELPDSHPLLEGLDTREPDDPCSYLLAIWTPGETADSIQPPEGQCCSQESGMLCNKETCFFCNSTREANSQTVRGTLLIPCRTAMRGSFPLNGTYFQVNEVFADHASSLNPIAVPRSWLWNLPRRTVYFGTSIPTIFKGMTTEAIQYCFWRGFVCVRGFDQKTRAPRPLMARLHFPVSHLKRYKAMADEKEKLKQ